MICNSIIITIDGNYYNSMGIITTVIEYKRHFHNFQKFTFSNLCMKQEQIVLEMSARLYLDPGRGD